MKYSAIIVTYNRKEKLVEALNSLLTQKIKPIRIILIDNNSTDGTEELLKDLGFFDSNIFNYIKLTENIGGSGGFYEGIRTAMKFNDDEFVAISDDDAIYSDDFFEKISEAQKKYPDYQAFCGSVRDLNGDFQISHRRIIVNKNKVKEVVVPKEAYGSDFDVDTFSFVGCVISKKILEKIGLPKKEYFIYYDDTEYSMRVRKLTPIKNITSAVIDHKVVEDFSFSLNWKTYYGVRNELNMRLANTDWNLMHIFLFLRLLKKYSEILLCPEYKGNRLRAIKVYHEGYRDGLRGKLGKNLKYQPGKKF